MNPLNEFQEKIELFLKDLESKKLIILPNTLNGLIIQLPPKNQVCDFACNAAMMLAKINKKSPLDMAIFLKKLLHENFNEIDNIEIAKPGFLNIIFHIDFWENFLFKVIKLNTKYGSTNMSRKKYNVEFVSANPTGPLHVGHCRGAILGDVLSNLLLFNGHDVTKEYYVNDYGIQINNFVKSVYYRILEHTSDKKFPNNMDLYPGDYIKDIAKEIIKLNKIKKFDNFEKVFDKLTEQSLKLSINIIKDNLNILGIKHNSFVFESELIKNNTVSKAIQKLKKKNYIYEGKLKAPKGDEASKWKSRNQILFKSTNFGDDTDRALQKADMTWTYFAGDIGYHEYKISRNFDVLINILGADHAGYIKRIKAAVLALSEKKVNLECKVSQLVKLFKNNQPFKMSKRKGDYITVEDLVNEVGKDSVRFMMLNRSNDVELDFDFKKVTEKSKENPVFYVQYAFARINSIFRNLNLKINEDIKLDNGDFKINKHELEILKKIAEWPKCVEITLAKLEPHIIPFYLYELSTMFHAYWNMGNDNKDYRFIINNKVANKSSLIVIQALSIVLINGMSILGVSLPSSM